MKLFPKVALFCGLMVLSPPAAGTEQPTSGAAPPPAGAASPAQTSDTPVAAQPTPPETSRPEDPQPLLFFRPSGCVRERRWSWRQLYWCESEQQLEVSSGPQGIVRRLLPETAPRNPYPPELLHQWRICTGEQPPAPAIAARLSELSVPYEAPDLPRCWLLRDDQLPPIVVEPVRGAVMLNALHPYLADSIRRMILRAREEGFEFRVISGVRKPGKRKVWVEHKVKRQGRWVRERQRRTVERGQGWHTFGLAVDINLVHRRDLRSASRAFLDPESPERVAWLRIGELATEYGLIWLGTYKASEIFHLEWHPGWPGMPKGRLYQQLRGLERKGGLAEVYAALRYDPSRKDKLDQLIDRLPRPPSHKP